MSLTLVPGPMFAGKTTHLIEWINKMSYIGRVLSVKHSSDSRYTKKKRLVSHDGRTTSCVTANLLREAAANPSDFEYLAVDEAQFFPDLIEVCNELSRLGKHIILVALLCGDCRWVTSAYEIIPYIDDIIMLKAKCSYCSSPVASISRRRNRAEPFFYSWWSRNLCITMQEVLLQMG